MRQTRNNKSSLGGRVSKYCQQCCVCIKLVIFEKDTKKIFYHIMKVSYVMRYFYCVCTHTHIQTDTYKEMHNHTNITPTHPLARTHTHKINHVICCYFPHPFTCVRWVVGSILRGGPIELFLVPASAPRQV